MQMLTKFESKSNRVKGVAFHPSLPLLAATLYNGSIQLWNYQTGTIYDRLDEHDGPVRGICFHPTQPLLVSSGDDSKIKVWNHKTRTCLFTLHGHLDYVRTVFFHHTQPWILSASDDQTIRIWNWQSRQCIAILTGHNHYVMCAQFHPRDDFVVSASMDQTVRVWDISGLRKKSEASGANGTAAGFGAGAPMSLEEQIARAASGASGAGGAGIGAGFGGQADLFGSTDAMVKYVLEGHDRGVNWASFHPTLPLIVSAGDDRQVKLWRMSETKAWEVDTCRGHFNQVSSALFHPRHELIISDAEDKTIRVWDMGKRTAVQTFRRESDRFWVLTAHPNLNLFAAGHDTGLIVFKLERERPAYAVHNQSTLYYVRDKMVRQLDFTTGADHPVLSVKKLGSSYVQPRTLSFNPAERSVLVVSSPSGSGSSAAANGSAGSSGGADAQGTYDLAPLPRDGVAGSDSIPESASVGKRGHGSAAIFVARNRLAVLDRAAQQIEIRDLSNNVTKAIPCPQSRGAGGAGDGAGGAAAAAALGPTTTHEIFFGGTASLLLSTNTGVMLYDIQQQKVLGEVASPLVKYVAWSADGASVALLSKHTITIASKTLAHSTLIHETIRIKSACWDADNNVLVYTTLNHIKYALPNGDSGIIKTLQQPVYVTRVKGKTVSVLDRTARPRNIAIDPTEYRFKLALSNQKYDEVLSIIKNSNLVGQAIIAYLQKKGYPEIALHFVNDKTTRFDLAIECGNLDVALETAEALGADEVWHRLAEAALKLGNVKIVERAYQRTKAFDKLSFLYLITGNTDKLAKMSVIAERRGDAMSRYHNALYLGDATKQIDLLKDVGMDALAYATARSHGLLDEAAAVAEAAGETPGLTNLESGGHDVPAGGKPLGPPPVVTQAYKYAWPMLPGKESFFDKALVADAQDGQVIFKDNAVANGAGAPVDADEWLEADGFEDAAEQVDDPDGILAAAGTTATGGVLASSGAAAEEAWDLEETELPVDTLAAPVVAPIADRQLEGTEPGVSETEHWLRNSPLAADHCAAGSFETAMTLLSRQVGVVNFAPLKDTFLALSVASRASLPAAAALDPLELPLRRDPDETSKQKVLPARAWTVRDLSTGELQDAYKAVNGNKLEDAQTIFRGLLYKLLLTVAVDQTEATEVNDLLLLCREYLLGIAIELERREKAKADPAFANSARGLELAALFTHAQMQPPHLTIALRSAMNVASKAGNFAMAASFAKRLLELQPPPPERVAQQAQQVLSVADRSPRDAVPVPTYDPRERTFVICGASHTLIPAAHAGGAVLDPLTQQAYLPEYKGSLCRITGISEIGKIASGLRPMA